MSGSAHSSSDVSSIRDVVSREKLTALNAGAVKDDRSQSLSTLAEADGAVGVREGAATAKAARRDRGSRGKAENPAGTNCPSGRIGRPAGASGAQSDTGAIREKRTEPDEPGRRHLAISSVATSGAMRELDDAPEFEGIGSAYDEARLARRAYRKAKGAKAGAEAMGPAKGGKAAGAEGASKKASGKSALGPGVDAGAGAKATRGGAFARGTQAGAEAKAAEGGAAAARKAAGAKAAGAVAPSALAPVAGIVAGALAFVLAVLVVSQAVSAVFGFWEDEASRQSMEGLPPYITYEMVEAALECQEACGHPAGCTIAQIIAESGQGDHMSQLATRDHNLFGLKWASSFAACPEVTGKSSWRTGEVYDGAPVVVTAYFTAFKSDVDCIKFRSRVFLKQPHFANNASIREAMDTHDSDKMAEGLKEGGWATSPTYVESLKSIMDAYDLRRFDAMSPSDWRDMDARAQKILAAAESQLGVPYVWGGSTPGVGLDCSGLTQYCYARAGVSIGHNTEVQSGQLRHVPLSEAKPGDILYRSGHVAIYAGGDQYIHEPHSGDVCKRSTGISYFSYALTYRTA